jgi:uncharacterized protein (TIGR03435 family)
MRSAIPLICFLGAGLQAGFCQSAGTRPAFEVISIKPSDLQARSGIGMSTCAGGRIVASKSTLQVLIEKAFNAQPFEIEGLSGWMNNNAWDIDARPPASSKSAALKPLNRKAPPNDEQRQMLQSLLADRFHLRFHREVKQQPVFFLDRGSNPLKLEGAKVKDGFSWVGSPHGGMIVGDGVAGTNVSMPALADRLSRYLERRVLDRTHISGSFDFTSNYASGDPHPDVVSTIITSLGEIGLKLESGKAPVETIVIDHAELPSPN